MKATVGATGGLAAPALFLCDCEGGHRLVGVAAGTTADAAVNLGQLAATELRLPSGVDAVALRGNNVSGRVGPAAAGADALAVGLGASAQGSASLAIGTRAVAGQANAVAIGVGVRTTRSDQVALGNAGNTYTLAGLGSDASRAAQGGATKFVTADADGNLGTAALGPERLASLDTRLGTVESRVDAHGRDAVETRREARQGVASAMAMASASMPSAPGRTTYVVNSATDRGAWAGGAALMHRLPTVIPLAVSIGYAYGGDGSHGVRAGLGGEF